MDLYQTPILLKGYHPEHNPKKDYKTAKTPTRKSKGFTKPDYKPPASEEVKAWEESGGWTGHLVPKGCHVIDVEDPNSINVIQRMGLNTPINRTNNGIHIFFSTNGGPSIPGTSKRTTRIGFPVTDRAESKNYVILPPTNGRKWENEDVEPQEIPESLLPARKNNQEDVLHELAWCLGEAHKKGLLAGYEDLDGSFMTLLVEYGVEENQVQEVFLLMFPDSYDENRTRSMYTRTVERKAKGENLLGIGSLVNALKAKDLTKEIKLITTLEQLSSVKKSKKVSKTKTNRLIDIALSRYELFHDKEDETFAAVKVADHWETYRTSDKAFTKRLSQDFWNEYRDGVGSQDIKNALHTIEGRAAYEGQLSEAFVRIARAEDAIHIDLGDEAHSVIEVTPDGWSVEAGSEIRFLRPPGLGELPHPVKGGSVENLRKYSNLENPDDFPLLVGFIIGCYPNGPYSGLELIGGQGSAKSTLIRIVKRLIDPSPLELRSLPRNLQDLSISAANSWLLDFDNVSSIPNDISDALCRLSTGGGFTTRTLYSNRNETLFSVQRPFMLNGINVSVSREDLADRMICLNMAKIPEEKRRSEREFWQDFSGEAPAILGAILDAVSCSLRNYRSVKLPYLPRMADFAIWVTAAEPALGWESGTFLKEYSRNRTEASSQVVSANLVLSTVLDFMKSQKKWKGTPTELHDYLGSHISEEARKSRQWPKSPNHLSKILNRGAEPLKQEGVAINPGRTGVGRSLVLENLQKKGMTDDGNTQLTLCDFGGE